MWPALAIRHTGMLFIRQEVAVWFEAQRRTAGIAGTPFHTVPLSSTEKVKAALLRYLAY